MFRQLFTYWFLVAPLGALDLSWEKLPERVRAHHPGLQAARLIIDEARGRRLSAGRLSNPTLNADWRSESRLSPMTGEVALEQAFPVTRRLALEKRLTDQLVAAAEWEVKETERKVVAEARQLAVRLLALEKQRTLRSQQLALAEEWADFAKGRAEAGEISSLDARQIELDAQRLVLESRMLEAQSVATLGQLKPFLGLSPDETLHLLGQLSPPTLPAVTAGDDRPDYLLAQSKLAAAQTDQALAKAKKWQDVNVGLVGGSERQTFPGSVTERTGYVGLRFSLPLPFWNRNEGELAEKAASAERLRLEVEALKKQIAGEAGAARQEMEAHAAIVRETQERLLPLAAEQMEALQKAYESGQTDLQAVLRARDQHLQLQAATLDALRDFHLARVRYEAALSPSPQTQPAP